MQYLTNFYCMGWAKKLFSFWVQIVGQIDIQMGQVFLYFDANWPKKAVCFFFNLIFYSNSIFAQIQFHLFFFATLSPKKPFNLHFFKILLYFFKSTFEPNKPWHTDFSQKWLYNEQRTGFYQFFQLSFLYTKQRWGKPYFDMIHIFMPQRTAR